VDALRELGFVYSATATEITETEITETGPARTAPIQQRRWLSAIPQRYARLLSLTQWTANGLSTGPGHAGFWSTAAASTVLYLPLLATAAIWLADNIQRKTAKRSRARS
jgi:hypothetical protein